MKVRITTLSENTAGYGLIAEWGLSVLVEVGKSRILVDTGMSFSATYNADLMGIDLREINCIVLSHGHTDHTGGLREVLKRSQDVDVVAHPDIWTVKYVQRDKKSIQFIGVPFSREELENRGARFNLSKEPVFINEHIVTTGEIEMASGYEAIEDNLFIKKDNVLLPDALADDLALVINTEFGLVVILGCAHRGIINTLRHAQKITGNELVYAVVGGTHLFRASEEQIRKTMRDLKKMGVQRLGVSHCTGFHASALLAAEFPGGFFLNNAGTTITLP